MRKEIITRENKNIRPLGRILYYDGICYLGYSASEIGFFYNGDRIAADIVTDDWRKEEGREGWAGVFIGEDKEPFRRFPLKEEEKEYEIFDRAAYAAAKGVTKDSLPKELAIRIVKYSEVAFGAMGIRYLLVEDGAELRPLPEKKRKLEFIGDSITCGYGIEGVWNVDVFNTPQENPFKNYALRTARALDADYQLVSWSGIGLITDWIPPERDTPDETVLIPQLYPYTAYTVSERLGIKPEEWEPSRFLPDLVIIHLGTNDDSYTRQNAAREAVFLKAYRRLYQKVRENYGDVEIVCCLGIMVRTLCPVIAGMVEELRAAGDVHIHYLEFEGQRKEDGIAADWHPSEITHRKAAEKLTEFCRGLLGE
ncbi:MAG: GDSL family lipase [Lachnospiraceae bacterium]|nr:GDSL family lipase [Lachnospiraceae bacterium]